MTNLFREVIFFGTNQIQMQGVYPSSQPVISMYVQPQLVVPSPLCMSNNPFFGSRTPYINHTSSYLI